MKNFQRGTNYTEAAKYRGQKRSTGKKPPSPRFRYRNGNSKDQNEKRTSIPPYANMGISTPVARVPDHYLNISNGRYEVSMHRKWRPDVTGIRVENLEEETIQQGLTLEVRLQRCRWHRCLKSIRARRDKVMVTIKMTWRPYRADTGRASGCPKG